MLCYRKPALMIVIRDLPLCVYRYWTNERNNKLTLITMIGHDDGIARVLKGSLMWGWWPVRTGRASWAGSVHLSPT